MTGVRRVPVAADDAGVRLDRWFGKHFPELPFGRLQKLLRSGQVRVDGGRAKAGQRLQPGQEIRIPPLSDGDRSPAQQRVSRSDPRLAADLRARVLHRDDFLMVIDKPPGLAVQGGSGTVRHLDGLLGALAFEAAEPPRLVHRLDKDTSGILVLARSAPVAREMAALFRTRRVRKLYWAVVAGAPDPEEGMIVAPLAKVAGRKGERMAVDAEAGKRAETAFRTIDGAGTKAAWLALEPLTGRTHQLRAHCAYLGCPILGDGKYGGAAAILSGLPEGRRLHLHARSLRLPHPGDGKEVEFVAPLPPHMAATWDFFGFDRANPGAGFGDG